MQSPSNNKSTGITSIRYIGCVIIHPILYPIYRPRMCHYVLALPHVAVT